MAMLFYVPAYSKEMSITVFNNSIDGVTLQVKDEVCRNMASSCIKAEKKVKSKSCIKKKSLKGCKKAKKKLESKECIAGLIFEGALEKGEEVELPICRNSSGYGRLSIRNIDKSLLWTAFHLLNDGETIRYP